MSEDEFRKKAKEYGLTDEEIKEMIEEYNDSVKKGVPTLPLGYDLDVKAIQN